LLPETKMDILEVQGPERFRMWLARLVRRRKRVWLHFQGRIWAYASLCSGQGPIILFTFLHIFLYI
jgi:hypothetical protein